MTHALTPSFRFTQTQSYSRNHSLTFPQSLPRSRPYPLFAFAHSFSPSLAHSMHVTTQSNIPTDAHVFLLFKNCLMLRHWRSRVVLIRLRSDGGKLPREDRCAHLVLAHPAATRLARCSVIATVAGRLICVAEMPIDALLVTACVHD